MTSRFEMHPDILPRRGERLAANRSRQGLGRGRGRKLGPALLLLGFLCLPAARAAEEVEPLIKQAEQHLESWRVAEAEKLAAALASRHPRSAPALDLQAWVSFYRGDYAAALRAVEQALALDPKSERRQALRLFVQQTRDRIAKLKSYESEHFVVFLDEQRDGILAPLALDALEKSYRAIGEALGYSPADKVRVEIAPDAAFFNAISTLSRRDIEETGAVGICKFNKIMILSPRALLQGYRWLDSLSHEYLHYAIVALSDNRAPIWLHEGMARYYESRWRRPLEARPDYLTPANETLLARALQKNAFVGFEKMEPSLIHLESAEQVQLAYAEAASAVDFIAQRSGDRAVRQLLAELRTKPTPAAVEAVTGLSWAQFESEWKSFVKRSEPREIEGARVRRLRVRDGRKQEEDAVELSEIHDTVARNRAHLGDRLQEAGRAMAAAQEYRRALQVSPHSTIIMRKLARVLIRTGSHGEALAHLERARRLDPDNAATQILLARALLEAKRYPEARAALREAIEINPFDPTIYQLQLSVAGASGDSAAAKEARAVLERLLRAP